MTKILKVCYDQGLLSIMVGEGEEYRVVLGLGRVSLQQNRGPWMEGMAGGGRKLRGKAWWLVGAVQNQPEGVLQHCGPYP